MKKLALTILSGMLACMAFSQSVIIFKPGPGLNDGTDQGGLNGGKDTYVYDELYTTNYGSQVIIATNPVSTCNLTNLQAYGQFDVSTLPAEVDSVFLWFYNFAYNAYCYSNCDNTFDLRYVTSEWDEMALTWESRPSTGDPISDTVRITFPYNGGPLRLDITEAYRVWRLANTPNYGYTIYPLDGWCNNACVSFASYSSDYEDESKRPYLEVYYNTSGTDEPAAETTVLAYPNPAQDHVSFRFSLPGTTPVCIDIFDLTGRKIASAGISGTGQDGFSIPVNDLPAGCYVGRIIPLTGYPVSFRFQVTRL